MEENQKNLEAIRESKDTVFRQFFRMPKNSAQLCSYLLDRECSQDEIEDNTLERSLFGGFRNDLSFQVGNQQLLLFEHQSTPNKKMALRMFMYTAQIWQQMFPNEFYHASKRGDFVPEPSLYVFYNGRVRRESEYEMRLSDLYPLKKSNSIEVIVKVFNINKYIDGRILKKVQPMYEYSFFIERVRFYQKITSSYREAVLKAIDDCLKAGIMYEYFEAHKWEAIQLMELFMTDEQIRKAYAEAAAEEAAIEAEARGIALGEARGIALGEARGIALGETRGKENTLVQDLQNLMMNLGISLDKAMDLLNVSSDQRDKYRKLIERRLN